MLFSDERRSQRGKTTDFIVQLAPLTIRRFTSYMPIRTLHDERRKKEIALDAVDNEEAALTSEEAVFYRRYTTLVLLYPRIKKTLQLIEQKEKSGELPPIIDSDLIRRILDEHRETCPLCDGHITQTSITHLEAMLSRISVSSTTSNNLNAIKGPLEDYADEIAGYRKKREDLKQRRIDVTDRRTAIEQRLKEISSFLSNFGEGTDEEAIASLEKKRKDAVDRRDRELKNSGAADQLIRNAKAELKEVLAEIKQQEKQKKEFKAIQRTLAVYDMMSINFTAVKDAIMDGMKSEISDTTWKIFRSMIWKQSTFGKIEIDDNYSVTVYDQSQRRMTGSLGATEQMALAYAFTLAIHEASGKNCPLVIDSPLGRVSDDNRLNMAKVLLDISKKKQIIMLFTPDEFSDSVKRLFTKNAQISQLTLSDNEEHVSEVPYA